MKILILILILLFSFSKSYSQQTDTVFTKEQVLRIAVVIDSLEAEIRFQKEQELLNKKIINELKSLNSEQESKLLMQQRYATIREAQLKMFEENLEYYTKYLDANKRPIWDKPILWFFTGAATIYFSSVIVANIK